MKKYIAWPLCLAVLLLAACAAAAPPPPGIALEIDYILAGGQTAQEDAQTGPDRLPGRLRERLRTDAQDQQAPARGALQTQGGETAGQNSTASGNSPAGRSVPEADGRQPASGQNTGGEANLSAQPQPDTVPGDNGPPPPPPSGNTVTMHIRADTFVASGYYTGPWPNIIPPSGVILPVTAFEIEDGDTVYDLLRLASRRYGVRVASRGTGAMIYVEGIAQLFEFDGGPLSGWMYSVNDWYPNFGAGGYLLSPGDRVEWNFTTDLGQDLGVDWLG